MTQNLALGEWAFGADAVKKRPYQLAQDRRGVLLTANLSRFPDLREGKPHYGRKWTIMQGKPSCRNDGRRAITGTTRTDGVRKAGGPCSLKSDRLIDPARM
jgi:hypothetical protein